MHSHALLYSLYANIFVLFAGQKRRQQQQTATKFKHSAIQKSPRHSDPPDLAPFHPTPIFLEGSSTKSEARLPHKRPTHKHECVDKYIYTDSGRW